MITAAVFAIKVSGKRSQDVTLLEEQPARDLDAACSVDVHARRLLPWT
jgi:hypothetical protein